MDSVMTHMWNMIPEAEIQRSSFDRSHGIKTTFDAGYLIPVYVDEALPGDTFNLNMSFFARLSTPLFAPMDNMFLESFFFAVPYRLVWDWWEKFNGAQDSPTDSTTTYTCPRVQLTGGGAALNSLWDYFGIPTGVNNLYVNAFHSRAYNLIWNTWFRDQNIQNSVTVDKGAGPDTMANYVLLRRQKRHDYFTSCLPWPQKSGGSDVTLPLGTSAPISGFGAYTIANTAGPANFYDTKTQGATVSYPKYRDINYAGGNDNKYVARHDADGHLDVYADLSSATAATINAIRTAFQLQRLYERDARGGTRYTELVKSHFGVTSPDARLQRPEFLGGGSSVVNVHPVASTNDASTLGKIGSFGTVSGSNHGFTKSFTEHCLLLGLVSVRADLTYDRGLDRMWTRQTRFDFYWPALSHLGEQSVLTKEIFCDNSANDALVFGYQERYGEYRYKKSAVTSLFRTNAAGTLSAWTLTQAFTVYPTLSDAFIVEDPPIDRVIKTASEPHFIFDGFIKLQCARPMPTYAVPGMMDHF